MKILQRQTHLVTPVAASTQTKNSDSFLCFVLQENSTLFPYSGILNSTVKILSFLETVSKHMSPDIHCKSFLLG